MHQDANLCHGFCWHQPLREAGAPSFLGFILPGISPPIMSHSSKQNKAKQKEVWAATWDSVPPSQGKPHEGGRHPALHSCCRAKPPAGKSPTGSREGGGGARWRARLLGGSQPLNSGKNGQSRWAEGGRAGAGAGLWVAQKSCHTWEAAQGGPRESQSPCRAEERLSSGCPQKEASPPPP